MAIRHWQGWLKWLRGVVPLLLFPQDGAKASAPAFNKDVFACLSGDQFEQAIVVMP